MCAECLVYELKLKIAKKHISNILAENASLKAEVEKFTAERSKGQDTANTGSPKLFLLQLRDVVECNECSDADKVAGVKLLVAEQLRAGA